MPEEYTAETYGQRWADIYVDWTAGLGLLVDGETIASKLADLAGGGPALELAIGTGRVALPLTEMGVEVHGIDISEAMVDKLRAKPGGGDVPVTIGDFAAVPVEGRYPLIYLVFNTIFALTTQEDQVRCFANAAEHLTEDGIFVIEAFLPDLTRYNLGQRVEALEVGVDSMVLNTSKHDPGTQTVQVLQLHIKDGSPITTYPVKLRYAFPSELDLMARLGGLRLRDRWGGWEGEPYTGLNPRHVSVYELDPSS
jgi:SAM-dependent methyltransferase